MKICIVSHNAFGAISGREGHIGGVEMQTAALARHLAEQGHDVTLLVWNEFGAASTVESGVKVSAICHEDAGLPVLKFFSPRWTSLHRRLRDADAEIYYHNGAEYFTGQVAFFCRMYRRAFVFSTASDADCLPDLPFLGQSYERWLYRFGLRRADAVICQTQGQQRALLENFNRAATILPMPCSFEIASGRERLANSEVLWVGRVVALKRLELYLDVAESLPDITFHIAGGADDDEGYAGRLFGRASALKNVVGHGVLDRQSIMNLYQRCSLLLCTSSIEGFPNTFIEAWGFGMPVVTSFDPDNLIRDHDLGAVAHDSAEFATVIRKILADDASYRYWSDNALQYFKSHHERRLALGRFAGFLQQQVDCYGSR